MKNLIFAVSCLLFLSGVLSAKAPDMSNKQYIRQVMHKIYALNKQADTIIQQRDRLTAHLRTIRTKQQSKP